MSIRKLLQTKRLYFDGGTGTLLQARGLRPGELPETWNLSHPDVITELHLSYLEAGANILCANTFGAYRHKFGDEILRLIPAAIANAKAAVARCSDPRDRFVALDLGPCGQLLEPLGSLGFEDAVRLFAESVRIGAEAGADLILIETMNDAYETKAAVLAAKENSDLPVFVTCAYDESGKLMTGADPRAMVALLEGLRVDALGINCSVGPLQMKDTVAELLRYASVPVIVNPNAGLPHTENGKTVFDVTPEMFADHMAELAHMGACVLGGCCGTTPEHIALTVSRTATIPYAYPEKKHDTLVSSYTHAVSIGDAPVIIGERINPTGKKRFKEALRTGDVGYILGEGLAEEEAGAHILDVNVGLPDIDEEQMLTRVVKELQAVTALPLQIDTVSPAAMAHALRIYNGKPLINSVNGTEESMNAILPLAAKYGGVLIVLTIGEDGIPATAEGRVAIARTVMERASSYGISKKDIVVDPLAMTVSADTAAATVTLDAIRLIKQELGLATSLGISNISFGLPMRDTVTAIFYAMALREGLDCAILNPHSAEVMKTYYAYRTLCNMDESCADYIAYATSLPAVAQAPTGTPQPAQKTNTEELPPLVRAIIKGLRREAYELAKQALTDTEPMALIQSAIIPALNTVGNGFESKTVFLPQLLMSAEAAKSAFDAIKEAMPSADTAQNTDRRIVLATVKGDIHDIGKNIVKVLLENYGYTVIDLGRDVEPMAVCDAVRTHNVRLVGLSALMTTTVPAMQTTIDLLRAHCPNTRVMVGGAVLTQSYADMIGADRYAKDAMQAVRYAEEVFE